MQMSEKKIEAQATNLELFPIANKKIELCFTGERISSDGGLLLLRETDLQTSVTKRLAGCITDSRDPRYISHTVQEMLAQRVFQIAAGYEDCNDCGPLRSDTVIKLCAGKLPQSGGDLASQPTMCRLENSAGSRDLYRTGTEILDIFIDSYTTEPKLIILDCDDTDTTTYGQQELALFNGYYNDYCYMPLHIYEGLSGKLVATVLKPGRRNKQADAAKLLKKIVARLRAAWPQTLIVVRGDSHFASRDFMDWAGRAARVSYITGLTGNAVLRRLSSVTIESAEREFKQYGRPVKRYHSFMYKAGSWTQEERVVVKVEATAMGTNVRYIVSDMQDVRAKDLYEKGYCARGAMELRIKEHKLYLKSDRASCNSFAANQFRLFMHSAAYILMHTMQKEYLKGTEFENATFKTIQNKIIKTAAWVRELKTRIKIEFPSVCPTRGIMTDSFDMFQQLRT